MAVREFELLKDLPNAKAGDIFRFSGGATQQLYSETSPAVFSKKEIDEFGIINPDKGWFREIQRNKCDDGYTLQAKAEAETTATKLRFLATLAEAGFHFTNWNRYDGINKVIFEIDDYPGDEDYPAEILLALDNCFAKEKK